MVAWRARWEGKVGERQGARWRQKGSKVRGGSRLPPPLPQSMLYSHQAIAAVRQ